MINFNIPAIRSLMPVGREDSHQRWVETTRLIQTSLGLCLVTVLFQKTPYDKSKTFINNFILVVWVFFAVYYKDYPVLFLSLMSLIFSMWRQKTVFEKSLKK